MRPRFIPPAFLVAAAACAAAVPAGAQGTISTQGFGYPPGQISAAAAALGGGPAETDAQSALNPASIAAWIRPGVYVEYAPEFRQVTTNGQSDHTTTSRFPIMSGAINIGNRVTAGISVSTLLDRTWETTRTGFDHFVSDSVQFTENFKVSGAIDDIKPGIAVAVLQTLWLGVSADVYSGDNNLTILRTSLDTTVKTFSQTSRLSYSGVGASGGIMWQPTAAVCNRTARALRGDDDIVAGQRETPPGTCDALILGEAGDDGRLRRAGMAQRKGEARQRGGIRRLERCRVDDMCRPGAERMQDGAHRLAEGGAPCDNAHPVAARIQPVRKLDHTHRQVALLIAGQYDQRREFACHCSSHALS